MSKIVARRNKDGRIEMLPRPVGSDDINPGNKGGAGAAGDDECHKPRQRRQGYLNQKCSRVVLHGSLSVH